MCLYIMGDMMNINYQLEDWRDIGVVSVTVSLCCVGIETLAKFWNVEFRPVTTELYPTAAIRGKCSVIHRHV